MKKLLVILLAALLMIPSVIAASAAVDRTEEGLVPDFSDDFEGYEVGSWIEETPGFAEKWSNNVLDNGEPVGMDSHLYERAKIIYENGNSGNKVLHLDNREGGNSFFYIGPKGDCRYKNVTISFKMMWVSSGWISAVVRKDDNVWYTGCNNINATLFVTEDGSCVQTVAYRNMPGAADQVLSPSATLDLEGYTISLNTYRKGEGSQYGKWFDIRYEINEKSYKVFVDDTLVMDLYYPSRKLLQYGYISFGGSVADVYFDDIVVDNLDTEAPPALEEEEEPKPTDPETSSDTASSESTPGNSESTGKKKGCGGSIYAGILSPVLLLGFAFKKRKIR